MTGECLGILGSVCVREIWEGSRCGLEEGSMDNLIRER